IVSLYMRNGTLIEYIKIQKYCNKKRLILQVAEAVNFLHTACNIVHGDIKCDNVLISDSGEALLADFGLSTFIEKDESATGTMTTICNMNTLRFAAPELLAGLEDSPGPPRSKTPGSDIYAFGMLILEV
ncbi:kinase-like protein, partial [Auricularia subglabra TFB-10046 SS5]